MTCILRCCFLYLINTNIGYISDVAVHPTINSAIITYTVCVIAIYHTLKIGSTQYGQNPDWLLEEDASMVTNNQLQIHSHTHTKAHTHTHIRTHPDTHAGTECYEGSRYVLVVFV